MKIKAISIKEVKIPLKEPFAYASSTLNYLPYSVIKVDTDIGVSGYGQVAVAPESTGDTQESARGAVSVLEGALLGKDATDIGSIIGLMDHELSFNSSCKAAVEAALMMADSVHFKLPLHKLIGKKNKSSIDITYTFGLKIPKVIEDEFKAALKSGFKRVKVKVGKDIEREEQIIKTIREMAPDMPISVDANQGWKSVNTAVANIEKLERYELDWIEQPIISQDIKGNARIRKAVNTRIMLDESVQSLNDCEYAICNDALDMVNIKLAKTGGVIKAKKIVELCNKNKISCILGSMVDSALAGAIAVHFAACSNFESCEMGGFYLIKKDIATGISVKNGSIKVPESIGTGIKMLKY